MPRLKVYRTAMGFHDAYVAAPSQKAALEAWGVDKNLFARGAAEVVTDPALTKEPLAHPGKVVRKSRGSLAEQLRALGPAKRPARKASRSEPPERQRRRPAVNRERPRKPPPPPPNGRAIEEAEGALPADKATAERETAAFRRREQALARERERLVKSQRARAERLKRKLERAQESYRAAFERWSERAMD